MNRPDYIPDYFYKEAWDKLYNAFGERMQQEERDLMDGVMDAVIAEESERRLNVKDLSQLAVAIKCWGSILFHSRALLSPDMQFIIENTIKCLKTLVKPS